MLLRGPEVQRTKDKLYSKLMQTLPYGDCWKWYFLNPGSAYGCQNGLPIIIYKEALYNMSCIAKTETNYKEPKSFFCNIPAFHEIS